MAPCSSLPVLFAAAAALCGLAEGADPRSVAAEPVGALKFLGSRAPEQTCFEVLADGVLPPSFEDGLVLPGSSLVRRLTDDRILSMTFNPPTFFAVADMVTQGLVCCHSGSPPELTAGDGSSPVFEAIYVAPFECHQPADPEQTFSLQANIADPQIIQEAVGAAASGMGGTAGGSDFQCGSSNSTDCVQEFCSAEQNGEFLGLCSRCVTEGGSAPLRSRCQRCCTQCPMLTSCFPLPASGIPVPPVFDGSAPTTRISVLVFAPDGRQLMLIPESPVTTSACCFEGAMLPPLPFFPSVDASTESFRDRFASLVVACSSGPVVFVDPAVYNQVLQ